MRRPIVARSVDGACAGGPAIASPAVSRGAVSPPTDGRKLAGESAFVDLSDYLRPIAIRMVDTLRNRSVGVLTITSGFLAAGLVAALLIASGSYVAWIAAAILIQIKGLLDAVDGSLARARQTPSRLGRFYDSFCDFVVQLALFGVLAYRIAPDAPGLAVVIGLSGLLSSLLQGSIYSYHTVAHRLSSGGDATSSLDELREMGRDDDWRLRLMHRAYVGIYAWQDRLVAAGDRSPGRPRSHAFLTATSALGLGTQLLVLSICLMVARPEAFVWITILPANLYALVILAWRHRASGRLSLAEAPARSRGAGSRTFPRRAP